MEEELRGVVWDEPVLVLIPSTNCPTCAIMSVLSWTLMLLLFVAGTYTCTGVAPQDADSFCLDLPSRPETNPRRVILLDTANYGAQDLVTILGQSEKWISLKLLPGPSNQKVCLALRMHACTCVLCNKQLLQSRYRHLEKTLREPCLVSRFLVVQWRLLMVVAQLHCHLIF